MTPTDDQTLGHLLDGLDQAAQGDVVSVQDVLDQIGDRSIMPVVLVIALMLVSPLSGIPGLPTLSSVIILIVMGQALLRREHLWLPSILRNRAVRADRLQRAARWMRRPAAWIDRHAHRRLVVVTLGPLRWLSLLVCMLVPMIFPFLELLPFVTSIGALAVALISFGLLVRDGLYVLLGYCVIACMGGAIAWLVQAGI